MKKCRFYFHFRSPYSWIGALWMQKYRKEFAVEYVPYWEVDDTSRAMLEEEGGEHYYTPMSKAKHLYILQDIKRITTTLGLQIKWPPSPDNQHWEIPHLAYIYAREQGLGDIFFDKILQARWLEGENICESDVIERVASACGLDANKTLDSLNDGQVRKIATVELMKSYEDGVFGIPFFIHGYNKYWGIDRFDLFIRSLQKSETPIYSEIEHSLPFYENTNALFETDHAGGCG